MNKRQSSIRAGAVVLVLATAVAMAAGIKDRMRYSDLPEVRKFVDALKRDHGLSSAGIMSVLRRAKKRQDVLDLINRPAEKALLWPAYRRIFIQDKRIEAGVEWAHEHRKILAQVSAQYGVPTDVILGIIGVETYFGRHMGKYLVFESLTTLAFEDNRRQRFFRNELREFFLLAHEQKLNPLELHGSYAGALGLGQFIPSSYRNFAVDFDDDGSIDLVGNPGDAIASVANYLSVHGWKRGQGTAWQVQTARTLSDEENARWRSTSKPKKALSHWLTNGIIAPDSIPADLRAQANLPLTLIFLPEEDGGQYWLGAKNYYAITRYNHSNLYAMAVLELSGLIKSQLAKKPQTPQEP